jgi:hypothetical protein
MRGIRFGSCNWALKREGRGSQEIIDKILMSECPLACKDHGYLGVGLVTGLN